MKNIRFKETIYLYKMMKNIMSPEIINQLADMYVAKFDELLEKTEDCIKWAKRMDEGLLLQDRNMLEIQEHVIHTLCDCFDRLNVEKEGIVMAKEHLNMLSERIACVYGPPEM